MTQICDLKPMGNMPHGGSMTCPAPGCANEATWFICDNCGAAGCRYHQRLKNKSVMVGRCWNCEANIPGEAKEE